MPSSVGSAQHFLLILLQLHGALPECSQHHKHCQLQPIAEPQIIADFEHLTAHQPRINPRIHRHQSAHQRRQPYHAHLTCQSRSQTNRSSARKTRFSLSCTEVYLYNPCQHKQRPVVRPCTCPKQPACTFMGSTQKQFRARQNHTEQTWQAKGNTCRTASF